MAKKTKSSRRWLERQKRDPYVQAAAKNELGSRAHFKIKQMDERFSLLRSGMRALELGAAPGGWTRYLQSRVQQVIAADLRPMQVPPGAIFLQCDITSEEFLTKMEEIVAEKPVDLVLSDMAPNISGVRAADQAGTMYLVELATDAARRWLKPGGHLVVKMFQGEGVDQWVSDLKPEFRRVTLAKPAASRPDSREIYGIAMHARF